VKLSNQVLSVLSDSLVSGNKLFLRGDLDRSTYVAVNKALEASGGKWNRKEKAHVFDCDAGGRVEQMILTGSVDVPKDEYDFFPTPKPIVSRLVQYAGIESGSRVLEPSAGRGAIAVECIDAGALVDCVEMMPANYESLKSIGGISSITNADFLSIEPNQLYDAVIMNPPFSKRAEIHHVNHALKFVKSGGALVSVMSSGITFRNDKLTQSLRDHIEANGFIEPIEAGAFKESGTMVNTVIVVIRA
jgi:predicted RNA methylase